MAQVKYTLKEPIVWGGKVIHELNFRQPKLKHLTLFDKAESDFEKLNLMIEKLCDITPMEVGEIDPIDLGGISEILISLIKKSQATS